VLGGLCARFYYDWLFIELLFIPEEFRGQDLGTVLLAMAEAQAHAWGAVGVWLDTFSFQARGFYEKRGYTVFAEIARYPGRHKRFYLQKRLDRAAPSRRRWAFSMTGRLEEGTGRIARTPWR
jgi:N-acetylglutamate synthase-like GNAT family acetyltransferase